MLNSLKILLISALTFVIAGSAIISSNAQDSGKNEKEDKNIFVVYNTGEDMQEFKEYALQMARLKPYGRVDICINSPALKGDFELPANSCEWHEYASYNRSVEAFFPDKKLIPFIPGDYITKNRKLLLDKVSVLRELGLTAAFSSNEPRFLPEAFFEKFPHLRGPRVDHPRRSVQKEYAPCFHQQETVEMYRNMVNQLFKNAPEIHSFYFSLNDAGSGSCWEDWLYSGPNGPASCKSINKSEGIVSMLNVYKEGAKQTGHDVDIYFKGMFTDEEMDDLVIKLPDNCFLDGRNYPSVRNISSMLDEAFPVRGIINPLQIIRTMSPTVNAKERYIFDYRTSYSRADERVETIEKIVDIVEDNLINPPGEGDINVLLALKRLCVKWAGEANSDQLFNAFVELDQAMNESSASLRRMSTLYWGVSARQITRPLVFAPLRLTPEEEKYFLPHIFNVSIDEARNDYMDIHGEDLELPVNAVANLLSGLKKV